MNEKLERLTKAEAEAWGAREAARDANIAAYKAWSNDPTDEKRATFIRTNAALRTAHREWTKSYKAFYAADVENSSVL